jgi:hypothetical protein
VSPRRAGRPRRPHREFDIDRLRAGHPRNLSRSFSGHSRTGGPEWTAARRGGPLLRRSGRTRTRGPLEHSGRRQRSRQTTPAPPHVRERRRPRIRRRTPSRTTACAASATSSRSSSANVIAPSSNAIKYRVISCLLIPATCSATSHPLRTPCSGSDLYDRARQRLTDHQKPIGSGQIQLHVFRDTPGTWRRRKTRAGSNRCAVNRSVSCANGAQPLEVVLDACSGAERGGPARRPEERRAPWLCNCHRPAHW